MPAGDRVHCDFAASRCFSGFKLISMKRSYAEVWSRPYEAEWAVAVGGWNNRR